MSAIQIPENAEKTSSGLTWLDESGIIIAVGQHHTLHTLEHAIENHAVNVKLAQGIPRPFLIDMTKVKSMTREARSFYAGKEPQKILTAVAILTESNIGKVVANFYLGLAKPILPTRMFTNYNDAKLWLSQFLQSPGAIDGEK